MGSSECSSPTPEHHLLPGLYTETVQLSWSQSSFLASVRRPPGYRVYQVMYLECTGNQLRVLTWLPDLPGITHVVYSQLGQIPGFRIYKVLYL